LMNAQGWGVEINRLPLDQVIPPRPAPTRLDQARPWSQIVPGMVRDDSHPPLYAFLVRAWEALWGDGEQAVRSLSVLFSLLAIVLLYYLGSETIGPSAALWACLLMAVAGPQIEFAQEAGKFMVLTTLALVVACALVRLRREPASISVALIAGGGVLAMMLTHYFAAGAAAGFALYALLVLQGSGRRRAITAFVLAALVFLVAWGPSLLKQRPNFTSNYNWVADRDAGHVARVLHDLLQLPARLIAESVPVGWPQAVATIAGTVLLLLVVAAIGRPALRLFVLWFCSAVGLLVILDMTRSTLQLRVLRYTLVASPPLYLLIAAAIPKGKLKFLPPVLAIAFALVRLPAAYLPPWKIDFRTPVEIVSKKLQPGDGLVLASSDPVMVMVTYTAFQHYSGDAMPATVAGLTRPGDAATLRVLRTCPRLWVVWMNADGDVSQWLPGLRVDQAGRLSHAEQIMQGTLPNAGPRSATSSPVHE